MKPRQFLNIDNFDPLEIDISFLEDVTSQIPTQGFMDQSMAEHLATVTLSAADKCVDLLAQATLFLSHCDANKRAAKSSVIKDMLVRKVPSTVVKDLYADEPAYIIHSNKYNMALAWSTWLENKYATLLKTHHLCKDLVKKTDGVFNASGFQPTEFRSARAVIIAEDEERERAPGKTGWKQG